MNQEHSPGLTGKGTPGADANREGTQGDAAAGDPAVGASLSVGDDHLSGPELWDISLGGPVVDTTGLESVFDEIEFPTTRYDVLAELERREDANPVSGVNIPDVVASMEKERFMNLAELTQAVREELSRRAHSA